MSILDRYIARRYLLNVVALLVALFAFVVAVDVFVNLRAYVSAAGRYREPKGFGLAVATVLMVIDIWGPRLLQLFSYLSGVALVGAMGFTCASFVRAGEFVAILAGGIGLRRLMRPIFIVALGVTLLSALNQEFILPRVAHLLTRDPQDAGQRDFEAVSVPLARDGAGRLFYAARFEASDVPGGQGGTLTTLQVWEPPAREVGHGFMGGRRIRADRAVWDGAGWKLENGRVDRIEAGAAPASAAPIERIDTDLDPTAILVEEIKGYGQTLSWSQIARALGRIDASDVVTRGRLERLQWGRVSIMLCNLLALAIALPFFLLREPRNMVRQSLLASPLCLLALMGAVLGAAAPLPGLPVWIGVFVPALALAPIALWATLSVKT